MKLRTILMSLLLITTSITQGTPYDDAYAQIRATIGMLRLVVIAQGTLGTDDQDEREASVLKDLSEEWLRTHDNLARKKVECQIDQHIVKYLQRLNRNMSYEDFRQSNLGNNIRDRYTSFMAARQIAGECYSKIAEELDNEAMDMGLEPQNNNAYRMHIDRALWRGNRKYFTIAAAAAACYGLYYWWEKTEAEADKNDLQDAKIA